MRVRLSFILPVKADGLKVDIDLNKISVDDIVQELQFTEFKYVKEIKKTDTGIEMYVDYKGDNNFAKIPGEIKIQKDRLEFICSSKKPSLNITIQVEKSNGMFRINADVDYNFGMLVKFPQEFDTMEDFVQALVKKVFIVPITNYALEIKKEENGNN